MNRALKSARQKRWADKNRVGLRAKGIAYYQANKEAFRDRERARLSDPLARAERDAYLKRYRRSPAVRAKRKAVVNTDSYRAYNRIYQAQQRAKKRGLCDTQDVAQLQRLYKLIRERLWTRCYWCGDRICGADCHIDHVIPLAKNGRHSAANLCISCADCNLSKNSKHPNEWDGNKQPILL